MRKTPEVKQTYRTYIEVSGPGFDLEIPVDIKYWINEYDPGQIYGPPELCRPPEGGELEVEDVKCRNTNGEHRLTKEIMNLLIDSAESGQLSEEIKEDAEAWIDTYEDLAAEAKIEERLTV